MNINWYPGHMKKTKDLLKSQLKLVDIVIELLDARIPLSSKNPSIDEIIGNKPKLIVLNKIDLAHDGETRRWENYYKSQGFNAIPVNTMTGAGVREIMNEAQNITQEKMDNLKKKGIINRPIRLMIVGIPNVGKSSIINRLAGKKSAKTGDRPGVTKGKQWIRLRGNMELLDTPGILWPKFEDEEVALNLAFTGAIKDEIMDTETLAYRLVQRLYNKYETNFVERYNIDRNIEDPLEVMNAIAINRGCILSKKEIDYDRVSNLILDEFRAGKLGKITLESPINEGE
ncbi:ribosome biogenesis GTPase YlqF [Serpentinicella alkaliphila]|uniref:Ribosome biogenesis GTPase A n=1 Tax=Serpentinicella alkaliphila TaxID=1734049 RepID=A0A4R2TQG6_9FIRM|nr:ribosome biogenesis GTPase YlqF [Serpentinicella alkaliphila]QUH26263.1 ribosome biogenesis GTPase YlqF [Serpentinicella alkaliphila]TCQ05841.1 ribosome biogenesis GTPase A [Serpentinicella alkaliphila]